MIIDNIYIGNLLCIINNDILIENSIKAIVSVFDGFKVKVKNVFQISIDDNLEVDITPFFEDYFDFLDKNKNVNILVHCQHGSSRSGAFVILYLMKYHKLSFEEALKYAKSKRPGIDPNSNFKKQLKESQFN